MMVILDRRAALSAATRPVRFWDFPRQGLLGRRHQPVSETFPGMSVVCASLLGRSCVCPHLSHLALSSAGPAGVVMAGDGAAYLPVQGPVPAGGADPSSLEAAGFC